MTPYQSVDNSDDLFRDNQLHVSSDRILVNDLDEDSTMGNNFNHPALSPEMTTNTSKLVHELKDIVNSSQIKNLNARLFEE